MSPLHIKTGASREPCKEVYVSVLKPGLSCVYKRLSRVEIAWERNESEEHNGLSEEVNGCKSQSESMSKW
jgi:hypothetical protein